jgi:hypothetical protein
MVALTLMATSTCNVDFDICRNAWEAWCLIKVILDVVGYDIVLIFARGCHRQMQ